MPSELTVSVLPLRFKSPVLLTTTGRIGGGQLVVVGPDHLRRAGGADVVADGEVGAAGQDDCAAGLV